VTRIAGHLGEYQGVRVSMRLARAAEDTEIVITTIERPNNPTYQVDWVVNTSMGSPKIVDLLAGGSSLRLTQSSDFVAYLARHQYNIHQLIEGMHRDPTWGPRHRDRRLHVCSPYRSCLDFVERGWSHQEVIRNDVGRRGWLLPLR
jgi:hypothetical protein